MISNQSAAVLYCDELNRQVTRLLIPPVIGSQRPHDKVTFSREESDVPGEHKIVVTLRDPSLGKGFARDVEVFLKREGEKNPLRRGRLRHDIVEKGTFTTTFECVPDFPLKVEFRKVGFRIRE